MFLDRLQESSGSVGYGVARYDNKDYIIYSSGSSSELKRLFVLNNGKLDKVRESFNIMFEDFKINDNTVSEAEYYNYLNSIEYPRGMSIEGLK